MSASDVADHPAVNGLDGLMAYSFEGDIYVADLASGTTNKVVNSAESDIDPIFAPDGTRIAFVRGTPVWGPSSLVVAASDGSNELVVVPEGFGARAGVAGIGPFAWTPDGTGIVVEVDMPPHDRPHHDGELTLFDASGVREPRLLVPPLDPQVGAIYFDPSAQIVPMFRPPDGDLILNHGLELFDADLTRVGELGSQLLTAQDLAGDFPPTWSPDGSAIVVWLTRCDGSADMRVPSHLVVIDAEDGSPREWLGPGRDPKWSPDGGSVAVEDWVSDDLREEARIVVHELSSGRRRVLESTASPLKRGAAVQTITNNVEHDWYYEGWSWSPDGRSLLILKDHLTRPVVVDVATDTAAELPWVTDSFPSWRRHIPH